MFKQTPNIYTLAALRSQTNWPLAGFTQQKDGSTVWVPARPLGYPSLRYRIKAAWLVFTGKADAVTWPEGQ